jgi:hypothetical protein
MLADQPIEVGRPRVGQEDRLFEIERAMRVLAVRWWSDGDRPAEIGAR